MLHPVVEGWFERRFGAPSEPQAEGWPLIACGSDTLISAPTGSGKTLAAFLIALDALFRQAAAGALAAIQRAANEQGMLVAPIRVAVRSGDTLAAERASMLRRPPHILVTTPESLYLLLTSAGGRK